MELDTRPDAVAKLLAEIEAGPVVFVYGSKEEQLNSAVALKRYVGERQASSGG